MKTTYKYIYFVQVPSDTKTSVWNCKGDEGTSILGQVRWYSPWRQYCFFINSSVIFHKGCLENVCHFIQQLMDERAANRGIR